VWVSDGWNSVYVVNYAATGKFPYGVLSYQNCNRMWHAKHVADC
jgi:hypothetical protein